ncbi:MAG: DUF429 domain-containing protein [Guyparkeria sp.]
MSERWVVGVDGCPGGWVAVAEPVGPPPCGEARSQRVSAVVARSLDNLLARFEAIDLVGIDMPIGLSQSASRDCDRAARGRLGARGSSVFPAPLRPALSAVTHSEASALSRQAGGQGVSAQAWNIFPKVRDLDGLLRSRPEWRARLVEVHPELSFLALNGDLPLPASKHRIDGIYRRRALIAEAFGMAVIESAVGQLAGTRVKEDDMLDAFAVLWSARRWMAGKGETLPPDPPSDAQGLPMRIAF